MKAVLETWKPIRGYEGLYEVSDYGCVRSRHGRKGVRYLKGNKDKDGYMLIGLHKNGKRKFCKVHRIVYESFRDTIPDGMQIDHINTVRDDNRLVNLRCVTPSENNRNPITAERMKESNRRLAEDPQWRQKNREAAQRNQRNSEWLKKVREGVRRTRAKAVLQINKDTNEVIREWPSAADAARELGISHISQCCLGKQKTAGGYRWRFATDDD